jgi:hypothetical protein
MKYQLIDERPLLDIVALQILGSWNGTYPKHAPRMRELLANRPVEAE